MLRSLSFHAPSPGARRVLRMAFLIAIILEDIDFMLSNTKLQFHLLLFVFDRIVTSGIVTYSDQGDLERSMNRSIDPSIISFNLPGTSHDPDL